MLRFVKESQDGYNGNLVFMLKSANSAHILISYSCSGLTNLFKVAITILMFKIDKSIKYSIIAIFRIPEGTCLFPDSF